MRRAVVVLGAGGGGAARGCVGGGLGAGGGGDVVAAGGGVVARGSRVGSAVPARGSATSRPVNVEGETRYFNQVVFANGSKREAFLEKLLEAYARWTKDGAELGDPRTGKSGK